jgi:hypothetical protein
MLGNRWREVPHFPHVLLTSVADLHICRLQAYGFIDSFTNSLNPTIEGLQTKIKRWINAEVTCSLGPTDNMKCKSHAPFTARLGGRACSCARPAGVRVRKLPSPPARPAAVRMCVRPPGVRARAQAPARCPQGPLTSATLLRRQVALFPPPIPHQEFVLLAFLTRSALFKTVLRNTRLCIFYELYES